MNRPAELDRLKAEERKLLQDLLDRFKSAWEQEGAPADAADLKEFLPPPGNPLRVPALRELIKADLQIQWRRGRGICLEQYLARFPELGTPQTLAPPLICEEYRVRHDCGDQPPLASYGARFPEQFAEVQRLIQAQPSPNSGNATLRASLLAAAPTPIVGDRDVPPVPPVPPPVLPAVDPAQRGAADGHEVLAVGGGYKLINRIGQGGFGVVWRAEAPGGVEVAIKVIFRPVTQEEASQRELQALELMRQLHHAYLLPIHAYWQMEDRLLIVMELADGSLRDCVNKCQQAGKPGIPVGELVNYFCEAAEAIDYLHSNRVLHRDIKPENILLIGGHAQVADFGLARVLEENRGLTATRGCGTPAYMAPEIIGQSKVGEQSDQYSLAVAYAELRLNRPLFPGTNLYDLMQDHLTRMPDLAPLPEAEQQVLRQALAKDPRQRYGSCLEFMQALQKALAPKPKPPPPPPIKRRQLVAAGLWFSLLVAIGLLAWYLSLGASAPVRVVPQAVTMKAGEGTSITLELKRTYWNGPVQLTFPDRPDNVVIADAGSHVDRDQPSNVPVTDITLPGDCDSVELKVFAAPDAAGHHVVTIRAESAGRSQEATFQMTVLPLAYSLPSPWQKAAEAKLVRLGGKLYYDRIDVLRGSTPVRFILIPKDKSRRNAPDTFYMMENKVWVALFRQFANEHGDLKNQAWRELPVNKNGRHPVMGVTAEDAHAFARWLAGDLPLCAQWDQAAGRYRKDRGKGPFLKALKEDDYTGIAVYRHEPQEIGKSSRDISPFGIRDMAGNGYELTRNLVLDDRTVPLLNRDPNECIKLRGCGYNDTHPLFFQELEIERAGQPYLDSDSQTGFRVVIEP